MQFGLDLNCNAKMLAKVLKIKIMIRPLFFKKYFQVVEEKLIKDNNLTYTSPMTMIKLHSVLFLRTIYICIMFFIELFILLFSMCSLLAGMIIMSIGWGILFATSNIVRLTIKHTVKQSEKNINLED